ncbi:MAG: ABC transporter ATP-binding protein [Bacteroidia bacterium]|nr:ABC transporter ATP-binding protein [Bacteroidia bacterium]
MSRPQEVIRCSKLSIGYQNGSQKKIVLSDIEAVFGRGDLAAIAGLNGSGKSTLLKTITGLLKPLEGDVFLFGKKITTYHQAELARTIGLVLTDRPDDYYLTVYETVAAGRSPHTGFWGRLNADDRRIIEQSLNYVGVSHLKLRLLNSISDGERQKVMIAKALAQDTPIIILDEPAAFLDFPSKIELMQLLRQLAEEQHKTILFSSHDLDLIIRTADKVWLVGNNAPIVQGAPEILLKTNAFARSFGNSRLTYDPALGHFQVHKFEKGKYQFVNDNEDISLISSALQRRGYFPAGDSEADLKISFTDNFITIVKNGETITFENFEQLIYGIQNL